MAFVNEYISEADYEKYDLKRICGEHNEPNRGHMHSRAWTIDQERDAFLIKVWSHRDSEFSGYAFYWKGEWMFFEMAIIDGEINRDTNSCWYHFQVRGLTLPKALEMMREELFADLRAGITASPGGMTHNYSQRSATIEFFEE